MKLPFLYNLYYLLFLREISLDKLEPDQKRLTLVNIKKHARIFLLMLIAFPYTYVIISHYYIDQIDIVITSLLGALFVSGTAWYAITFGAIPEKFMDVAVKTTTHLFAAFTVSLTAVLAISVIAVPLLSPLFVLVFLALYSASVKYDVTDALKLGIDDAIFKHAKVGRLFFTRELKKPSKKK